MGDTTIAAISTAPGNSGIGIVRISGEHSFSVIEKIFMQKNTVKTEEICTSTIKYGHIIVPDTTNIVDEVLVSYFKSPASYTTENMCEINCHGGNVITHKILELCLENGATLAEPGEFTKRAFLNGRIDLSQAESVIDVINSRTDKEAAAAISQLNGYLSNKIHEIKRDILGVLVDIEASIDYPEYDIEEVTNEKAMEVLFATKEKLIKLEKSFENGKIIKEGVRTAIIGKPNSGKSSLLNALLKEERAIVTEFAGTTRDTIEELISINGISFKFIDTAGIRNTDDKVEKIGIKKSINMASMADLVIAVFDASRGLDEEDFAILNLIKGKKAIIVLNKADLGIKINYQDFKIAQNCDRIVVASAINLDGLDELQEEISKLFKLEEMEIDNSEVITNIRHKELIHGSIESLNKAIDVIKKRMPVDIVAIYIKDILDGLGKITGESVSEDVINEIFAKFCLGK